MNEENKLRANRILCAATAVEAYRDSMDTPSSLARDILADLRHFCDLHELPFSEMNDSAEEIYQDEAQEPTT